MDEVGVQSKHRARQFVTKLWVSDCKGNFHLATCLCDNGSEVNLQSNSFLPDDCVFESPHPVTLEGVSGHSLAGGQRGCYISTRLVAQDLWEEQNVEEVVLKDDYFYRADIKYDLYLGHPWLRKNRVAPVGHRRCFLLESGPLERPEFRFLHAGFKSAEEFLKQKVTPKFGEDVTIAEVNGSADYSQELECLRRGLPAHDALRAGTLHPTELSTNGAMPFVNTFMNTIHFGHSMMPLLTVRTSALISTLATLGPTNGTRSCGLILRFT